MNKIQELKEELNKLNNSIDQIKENIYIEYCKEFDQSPVIKAIRDLADTAKDYEVNEWGEIEAYMECAGYYPDVFMADRYSNIYLVNTRS